MVHFVGGPSVGGYKSYINHTTAREGQWRMPRNYARPKVDIKIKNYNYCNHGAVNTGFQMPAWLQWAQFGMSFLQGLFPAKQEAPAAQPEVNPLQAELDKLKEDMEKLKKENEELKNKPTDTDPKVTNTPETETNANVDLSTEEVVTTETTPDTVEEKTVKVFNKTKKLNANQNEGYTWQSLQDAYVAEDGSTVPNSPSFRNWFRQTYLNGATDIGVNEQHYPKEITYGGKTYKFDTGKYKPHTINTSTGYNGTSAKTKAVTETKKGTTTTRSSWKGVAKATWTDKDGKTQTKTVTVSGMASKDATIKQLKADIKGQVPADAKITFGTKEQ